MQIHRLVTRTPLFAAAITIAAGLAAAPAAQADPPLVNLVSFTNNMCLQPVNGSLNAGDAIVQEPCDGSDAQQWTIKDFADSHHGGNSLVNRNSGLCLDARGGPTDGTPIQQWPCIGGNGISNESWNFCFSNNRCSADNFWLSSGVNPKPWDYCLTQPGEQEGLPMELQLCEHPSKGFTGDTTQMWTRPGVCPHETCDESRGSS